MSNEQLKGFEDHYPTQMGGMFLGERVVFRGRDLLNDLGDLHWFELLFFSATGFEADKQLLDVLSYIWNGCSYPDPRPWNNRVAALAGSTRSTASLAMSAGVALSEAKIYGHRANIAAIDFIRRAQTAVLAGVELVTFVDAELEAGRKIYGYGRPINGTDERVAPTLRRIEKIDVTQIPHCQLCFDVERYLKEKKGLMMNITGLAAAVAADAGMSPRQYHTFITPCFMAGMVACFTDAVEKPEGCVFPLRCDNIDYQGHDSIKRWND